MTTKDQAIALALEALTLQVHGLDTYNKSHKGDKTSTALAALRQVQAQPPAPDCRTCAQYQEDEGTCLYPLYHGLKQCTNGDQYQPAPKVVLWRTEP
jgi:hypothetical protein